MWRSGQIDENDRDLVHHVIAGLTHRGPDHVGVESVGDHCVFGAARLSIIGGRSCDQPLRIADGRLTLVYNGEIYNYRELRDALRSAGHVFRTDGDGEVVLALYRRHGLDLLTELDGMFAFALWDEDARRLVLGRDRMGIKPLYYRPVAGGDGVFFASELPALLSVGPPTRIDTAALAAFTSLRYCPPPATPVEGVVKVEPGALVVVEADRPIRRVRPVVGPGAVPDRGPGGRDHGPDSFGAVLRRAVLGTLPRDRPAGVLLSGGLDSSSVLAIAAAAGADVTAFSVGYTTAGVEDERPAAREVAAHLGVPLRETVIGDASLPEVFERTVRRLGEPVYTPVALSTFAVSELAAGSVRVALTGDGSDELLMGYSHYRRVAEDHAAGRAWRGPYARALAWLDAAHEGLLTPDLRAVAAGCLPDGSARDPVEDVRAFEVHGKLPEYHLTRVDRLSMAHGLEARVPFLRDDVVAWALGRSARDLLGRQAKEPLRAAQADALPRGLLDGPKRKFTAPVAAWLGGPMRTTATALLDAAEGADEMGLDPAMVRALAEEHHRDPAAVAAVTWGVIVLLGWYQWCYRAPRSAMVRTGRGTLGDLA